MRCSRFAVAAILVLAACTDRGGPSQPTFETSASAGKGVVATSVPATWTVPTLIDALFTQQNRTAAQNSWKRIVAERTATTVRMSRLQAAVNDLVKWTLSNLALNRLVDPDGAGPLNATTGAMKLLSMVFGYAGITATEVPAPPAGSDLNFAVVGPSTDTSLTTSLGDAQAVIPAGTFPSNVVIIIARQPDAVTVNTPYPKHSRVFDVSIAPEVSFQPFVVALCPFSAVPHEVNDRALLAHQKSESVVEYLARTSGSTLTCPEDLGSAWREERGVIRQRLAQAGSLLRSAMSLVTPRLAYAGHAAIGASLSSLSPSVIIDPYVTTSLVPDAVASRTYGQDVSVSATLTASSGPVNGQPAAGQSVVATLDDVAGTAQTAVTDASGKVTWTFSHVAAGSHTAALTFAGGAAAGNAPVYGTSSASQSFSVAKAPLTLAADDASREYGESNPALTGSVSGAQYGESITATYATDATPASNVGDYAIVPTATAASGVLDNYYVATVTNGTLHVTKAPLTVTYAGTTLRYGSGPGCVVTYGAFKLSDGPSSLGGTLSCSGPAGPLSDPFPVGTYTVTPGGLTSGNYAITFVSGSLTVQEVYGRIVFKSPVARDDHEYQHGATIPVAFWLYKWDNSTPAANVVATISMSGVTIPAESTTFEYDPLTQLYQRNIKLPATVSPGTHVISVHLDDGSVRTVEVLIK